jgi:hypothetical protein
MTPKWNTAYPLSSHVIGDPIEDDQLMVNDAMGSIHLADSDGMDEEMETGDAKWANFPTRED